jgi:competence protein ComEC
MDASRSVWVAGPLIVSAVLVVHRLPVLPGAAVWLGLCASSLALLAVAWRLRRVGRAGGGLAVTIALACAVAAATGVRAQQRLGERLPPALEGVTLRLTGVVDTLPVPLPHGQRFTLAVERCVRRVVGDADEAGACTAPPRVQLAWSRGPATWRPGPTSAEPAPRPRAGERWSFEVRLKRPHAAQNFGQFDRELRWLEEGIGAVGTVHRGERLDVRAGGVGVAIERARARIRDAVYDAAGAGRSREAGVLAALAIGDQSAIDADAWRLFNRTGVGHLMSISGLHVTMLAGLAGGLAGWLWRRRRLCRLGAPCRVPVARVRLAVAAVAGVAYALLAGWGVPAQRTAAMLAVAAALLALGRGLSVGTAVAGAAVAIVLLDPWAPLTAGFWLSFGAVLAIVWACSGLRLAPRSRGAWLRDAVRTQVAATVALVPLGAAFFGAVSVVGPVANALAIPLVSGFVTPLALAGGALAVAAPGWASWLIVPAAHAVSGLIVALQWLAALPASALPLPAPGAAALALACAGAAWLLAPVWAPHRWVGAVAFLPLAAAPLPRPGPGALWITALDVGQGTAVVVQAGHRALVYDTGPSYGPQSDAGSRVLVPWLQAQGIRRPDLLVVSHADDDHAGGARALLEALPPARFVSSLGATHPLVRAAADAAPCRRGDGWRWGDVEFEWLHPADPPERARGSPTNAVSCVLRVRSPGGSVLLTGDIEAPQERRLLERLGPTALAADVLLVPHHGSRTSSTEAFIDAVAPRWALVQAAYRSRFGHPHPAVVARYEARGIALLRSDADGAVQLRLEPGRPPQLRRARAEPARYWRVAVGGEGVGR